MAEVRKFSLPKNVSAFDRDFFGEGRKITYIEAGEFGGKATGLAFIHDTLAEGIRARISPM